MTLGVGFSQTAVSLGDRLSSAPTNWWQDLLPNASTALPESEEEFPGWWQTPDPGHLSLTDSCWLTTRLCVRLSPSAVQLSVPSAPRSTLSWLCLSVTALSSQGLLLWYTNTHPRQFPVLFTHTACLSLCHWESIKSLLLMGCSVRHDSSSRIYPAMSESHKQTTLTHAKIIPKILKISKKSQRSKKKSRRSQKIPKSAEKKVPCKTSSDVH